MSWDFSVKGGGGTATRSGDVQAVAPAFADMLSNLEITEAEQKKAADQQTSLRDKLRALLTIVIDYLSGSYRRRTINRPLNDIDVLMVLCTTAYPRLRERTRESAIYAIGLVERALRAAYPASEIIVHDRCVQIQFVGTKIGFDVTPAIRFSEPGFEDEFWIPDTRLGRWIRTNPKAVEKLMHAANARCGGRLVPLVKALKQWKDEHNVPLRGFQIEAMAYHALRSEPLDDRQGFAFLLNALANAVLLPMPDIWPLGEPADASLSWTDRAAASSAFQAAARTAERAVYAEAVGDPLSAHRAWRELFGSAYPETGEEHTLPTPLAALDAVDRSRAGATVSATSAGIVSAFAGLGAYGSPTSHGGDVAAPALGETQVTEEHAAWLNREIDGALGQFTALERIDPAVAAADPALWPVGPSNVAGLYAVLVGEQRTNFGITHRILVTIPKEAPAMECRVYLLADHRRFRFVPLRGPRHRWGDGALCTHALRDRCDGRLITLLVYAAEWLLRYDYYRMTGVWIGREIVGRGQLRRNERPVLRQSGGRRGRGH